MEESSNILSQVNWLGASSVHLSPMEELFNLQHRYLASILLFALLATLMLAKAIVWLETSGVYSSYDESLWKGTETLFRALSAPFRWSTIRNWFPHYETDDEKDRKLLDECGRQTVPPLRRSNSTYRRIGSSRKRLTRFKDEWKLDEFEEYPPPWAREQRFAWEKNVCKLYLEAMVRDHDALEAELAESENIREELEEEIFELKLRVDQNRNWYCKIWNLYKPGDVVKKAPMSMAKVALAQTDIWEEMYRKRICKLQKLVIDQDHELETMKQQNACQKTNIDDLERQEKYYRKLSERLSSENKNLESKLELSQKQASTTVHEEKLTDNPDNQDSSENEDEDEQGMASAGREADHGVSKASIITGSKELSTEMDDADANEDETSLSWT